MSSLFSSSRPAPIPSLPAPIREDPADQRAAEEAKRARLRARGRSGTILTSGLGVTEEGNVYRATLGAT